MFSVPEARDLVEQLVERARQAGADAADALFVGEASTGVQVRLGELEDVARSEGAEVGLRLFVGQRSASVSSSDLSSDALAALVERVRAMAAQAPDDPFAGLAPAELLLGGEPPDVDADDGLEPDPAELRHRALAAEGAALAVPGITNSGGAGANASKSVLALATSAGFAAGSRSSGHGCSVSVVAGDGAGMERDYAYHTARYVADLDPPEAIGERAGNRAAARLNPVRPRSGRMAVLFEPRVAASLLGHFASAINGAGVARRSTFLQHRMGQRVFAPGITITDDPLRRRGLRSRGFDGEGLATRRRDLVADGVLSSWLADSAAARQLGIAPTGHAVRGAGGAPGAGPSNLYLNAGQRSRAKLLLDAGEAVLVTELIGQGVNGVTGDYSRGASGFLVSGGEIGRPVSGITIASNLIGMFATLMAADDLEFRRGVDSPTLLVPEMTVAAG